MSVWPGGTSGVLGSPDNFQFLERWLTNESMSLSLGGKEIERSATAIERFVPAAPIQAADWPADRKGRLRAPFLLSGSRLD